MVDEYEKSLLSRADTVCEQFEADWQAGQEPRIAPHLEGWQGDDRQTLFRMLLELDVDYRGKRGVPLPPARYLQEFPEYAAVISEVVPASSHSTASGRRDGTLVDSALDARPAAPRPAPPRTSSPRSASNPSGGPSPNLLDSGLDRERVEQAIHNLVRELGLQKRSVGLGPSIGKDQDASGVQLGNYTLVDAIGSGGMGQVFRARHRRMDREVALKILPPEALETPGLLERFHQEVRTAAKLTHPNIVTAYDADEADGIHFLVMEYVEGQDLKALVKQDGPLSFVQAADCILQAAAGLGYAHSQGVVHRDIKPANLLRDSTGRVKVLDMGVASLRGAADESSDVGLTQTGSLMGTVDYMSPEQASNTKAADQRSDIYSLGCTLFYLVTGETMYRGDSFVDKLIAHQEQPAPPLQGRRSDVPWALDEFYQKMVAKAPDQRYQTMAEVIEDLEQLKPKLARHERLAEAQRQEAAATPRRSWLKTLLSALLLAGGTGVIAVLVMSGKLPLGEGKLNLVVDQPGALVLISGTDGLAQPPLQTTGDTVTINLPAGSYRLEVTKPGFQTHQAQILILPLLDRTATVSLAPE